MINAIRAPTRFTTRFYALQAYLNQQLKDIKANGLYKQERVINSEINNIITLESNKELCLCSNNYLGFSSDQSIKERAIEYVIKYGVGLSSARYMCGTQDIHKQLEHKTTKFLGTEDTILYSSCFDANAGLFEVLLTKDDVVISDELNHASIIDGIRLCKATKYKYKNCDMKDLETKLKLVREKTKSNNIIVATDAVFSMDGNIAPLDKIVALCERYNAMTFVDESHSTGVLGKTGRGCVELYNVVDKVHIINSTYGKALGGASGGFTSGKKEIVEILRQKSRPYLFSNSIAPSTVGSALRALEIIDEKPHLLQKLKENTNTFQKELIARKFKLRNVGHPITPIMVGDAKKASLFAQEMKNHHNIYVVGSSYPVVPKDLARVRIQMSAALSPENISKSVEAIEKVGKKLGIID